MVKNKIKIIGGDKKTTKTLEQLLRIFSSMPVEQIQKNLMEYTTNQMVKLYKILKQREDKVMNQLTLDYQNRKALIKQVETEIPIYDNIRTSYIKQLETDVNRFTDQIRDSNLAVQEIEESIKKFKTARDKFTDESYVENYREKCIGLFLNDKVSEAFNEYKLELLEYLIAVLNGKKPEQHPFNIIITGSPGLGKSHLAGEIVKILQATHLLPIGKFINIKKPDVIGQHVGQTAPKAYKNLVNGIGSIVFIDEAYSYAGKKRERDGYDPFGVEFINALVDFMEEYRGLLGIIAAGYEKEMKEQFLDVNIGLNRRFRTKLNMKELDPITIITRLYEKIKNPDVFGTYYIENFVRFAYHIEQFETNQINIIVHSDKTKKYEAITEFQASYILTYYFKKLFMDNWTDILVLFDYFQFNNSFDYTVDEQIQNVITEFIRSKLNSSDVLEISSRMYQENLVLQLKIKKFNWSNKGIRLLDNEFLHTEQEHIDRIKDKILGSIGNAVNTSDRNATVQEIEKRLNKPKKSLIDDPPPVAALTKCIRNRHSSNFNNSFAPPPPPMNSVLSVEDSRMLASAPPPLKLTDTQTESYYSRKYGNRTGLVEPTISANSTEPLEPKKNTNTTPAAPLFSFSTGSTGQRSSIFSRPSNTTQPKKNSNTFSTPPFSFTEGTQGTSALSLFSFSANTTQPKKNSNTSSAYFHTEKTESNNNAGPPPPPLLSLRKGKTESNNNAGPPPPPLLSLRKGKTESNNNVGPPPPPLLSLRKGKTESNNNAGPPPPPLLSLRKGKTESNSNKPPAQTAEKSKSNSKATAPNAPSAKAKKKRAKKGETLAPIKEEDE
jgi:hypothetical protein